MFQDWFKRFLCACGSFFHSEKQFTSLQVVSLIKGIILGQIHLKGSNFLLLCEW